VSEREAMTDAAAETSSAPAAPIAPGTAADRDAHGRFRRGNQVAVSTAFDARQLPPELTHLHAEVQQFVDGSYADQGDEPEHIPTRRKALLEYRARVHRRIVQLDSVLELRGLLDRRGRLRSAWLQRLEGLIGTARALDAQLGLERRTRHVDTFEAAIAAEPEAR
jgi:hypothetical protein